MTLDDILATVSQTLRDSGVSNSTIVKVASEVRKEAEASKPAKARKTTYQTVVLIPAPTAWSQSQPNGIITAPEAALVIQMEDSAPASAALDRITTAALSFNRSKTGRRKPVATVGEVFEVVKGKHWKDESKPDQKTRVVTSRGGMAQVITYTNALKLS